MFLIKWLCAWMWMCTQVPEPVIAKAKGNFFYIVSLIWGRGGGKMKACSNFNRLKTIFFQEEISSN